MKKFSALIFAFLFLFSTNLCYAINELYFIENINKEAITPIVENALTQKKYNIIKTNPYYALSEKNQKSNAVIIIEPSGQDIYYYFESNDKKGKKVNKAILKQFKKENINYIEYKNENYMRTFAETAQNTILGRQKTYSFENPQIPPLTQITKSTQPDNTILKGRIATVGKGSTINAYLQNPINTATARVGDMIVAILKNDWITSDFYVLAPQGSVLYGELIDANSAKIGLRNGNVKISFNKLATPDGKVYDLATETIDFKVTNEGVLGSSIKKVAIATIVGSLAGLALAALTDTSLKSSAAIGAGIGGGISLLTTTAEKGIDAEIPSYTELDIKVLQNINIVITEKGN